MGFPSLVRDDLRPLQRRVVVLAGMLGVVFLLILARLWVLQVLQGAHWRDQAEKTPLD